MNARVEALVAGTRNWSVEERLQLVDLVLSTLGPPDPAIDAEWVEECEQRLAAFDRGETTARDAAAVLGKFAKR